MKTQNYLLYVFKNNKFKSIICIDFIKKKKKHHNKRHVK